MSAAYVIQSGVPMPEIDRAPKGRRKYQLDKMGVGDMFFVPGKKSKIVSAYVSRISKNLPGKFSARRAVMWQAPDGTWHPVEAGTEDQTPGATEGTAVWRIE